MMYIQNRGSRSRERNLRRLALKSSVQWSPIGKVSIRVFSYFFFFPPAWHQNLEATCKTTRVTPTNRAPAAPQAPLIVLPGEVWCFEGRTAQPSDVSPNPFHPLVALQADENPKKSLCQKWMCCHGYKHERAIFREEETVFTVAEQ